MECLHITIAFRIFKRYLRSRPWLELNGSRIVESRLFDRFAFDTYLTESMGRIGSMGVFSYGAVANRAVGRVLPYCFKHDKINLSVR